MSSFTNPATPLGTIRICVAGSRSINDYGLFKEEFLRFLENYQGYDIVIVTGRAKDGPDDMAYHLARWDLGIPYEEYPADWKQFGNSAGMHRNVKMSEVLDSLFVMWDGESKGTKHMLKITNKLGKDTVLHVLDPETLNQDVQLFQFDD
jgi:hypothetical protein